MVLSLGKGFIVTPFTYSFSEQEGLKLTNNRDGFKLTLTSSPLFTDIYRLGNQMREDDQMSLTIKAGQQLLIFGIGPNELTSESLATDPNRAFGLYFMRRNPTFFTWDLPFEFNFGRAPHLGCIVIYSDEELTLRLEPSSLIDFMLSLIIGASPSTIQAVKESDPDGFIFILFKSLLYCAMGTTEDSSPYFELFSEATRVKLHVLRAQDPEFAEAFSNFLGDEKLRDQMSAILKKNPEGFKALAVDKLPPAVGVVVKKIKALAYGELQAKEFFNCLQAAIQKMNELGM
jgi:hypothetical protein